MTFKLGKKPARPGAVRFKLASYTNTGALPPLPAIFGHEAIIGAHDWGMLANDRYGDCCWAGAAHETMLLAREAGTVVSFADADVLGDYAAATGFDPEKPETDQGTDVQQAAEYRRSTGIVDAHGSRHLIAAYLALEPGNVDHLYQATYLFGPPVSACNCQPRRWHRVSTGKSGTSLPARQLKAVITYRWSAGRRRVSMS